MAIRIDVSKVEAAAGGISTINGKIRDDFSAVNDAINTLNRNWDGGASDSAMRAFDNIKGSYCDYRYAVINDLVTLLRVQVGSDYIGTEKKVKSAAEAFK